MFLNYQCQNVNLSLYYSTGCALWFQRIEEITNNSDESTVTSSTCSQRGSMNPRIRKSNKRKRAATSGGEEEEDIRAFQRVRLLFQPRQSHDASQFDPLRSHRFLYKEDGVSQQNQIDTGSSDDLYDELFASHSGMSQRNCVRCSLNC
jgi:hypothetical protein